jgi:hypothetical protein
MRMYRNMVLAATLGLVLLAGCEEDFKIETMERFGPGWTYAKIEDTYAWAERERRKTGDPWLDNKNLHELIRNVFEEHLAAKGYKLVPADKAEIWLDYYIGQRKQGEPYGIGAEGFRTYEEGALGLYVLEPKSKEVIWRVIAKARLSPKDSPKKRVARINAAVEMMLKDVEPRGDAAKKK